MLLVLDNFEHLLDAAAGVAETIGSCPRLTVLVTSREPLHIEGEWEVAVDPLRERGSGGVVHAAGRRRPLRLRAMARWPRSAGASTVCRSRSSWRPPV